MLPATGSLTPDQIKYVQKAIDHKILEDGITCEYIDGQIKTARGATSRFREGNYEHDESRLARRIDRWIKQHDIGIGGMPTEMVSTTITSKILGILKQIKARRSMGSIVGPSGVSKSTVRKACEAGLIEGCVGFELTETDRTMPQLLKRLTHDLGGPRTISSQQAMFWLREYFTGTDILIIIDEAHYLDRRAMNTLRDLHKSTGCPIALMGTQDLLETINDFNQFHGQMKSLFSICYNITVEANDKGKPLYTVDEIMKYATSMKLKLNITGASEVTDLANTLGWGGLRAAGFLMLNAASLAKGKVITQGCVLAALKEMEGSDGFKRTIAKVELSKKAAVA